MNWKVQRTIFGGSQGVQEMVAATQVFQPPFVRAQPHCESIPVPRRQVFGGL